MSLHSHAMRISIGLLVVALLAGGGANLAGVPALHTSFAELGLPVWFGYLIGALEVVAAFGLLNPHTRTPAAAGIVLIMLGAIYYHASQGHGVDGIPALVILSLGVYVFVRHRVGMRVER